MYTLYVYTKNEKLIFFLVKLKETGSLFTTFIIDIIHKKSIVMATYIYTLLK